MRIRIRRILHRAPDGGLGRGAEEGRHVKRIALIGTCCALAAAPAARGVPFDLVIVEDATIGGGPGSSVGAISRVGLLVATTETITNEDLATMEFTSSAGMSLGVSLPPPPPFPFEVPPGWYIGPPPGVVRPDLASLLTPAEAPNWVPSNFAIQFMFPPFDSLLYGESVTAEHTITMGEDFVTFQVTARVGDVSSFSASRHSSVPSPGAAVILGAGGLFALRCRRLDGSDL